MKINLIRNIDRDIGPIVCRFLLFCRFLLNSILKLKSASLTDSCKNILVVKFFGMGTILLASPALRELKHKYKHAKITILTLSSNRQLCEILPSIDNVICLKIDSPISFLFSFLKTISEIRRVNFDIIIDLEFFTNFSALIVILTTLLARPKITVGFNSPIKWRNDAHNINVAFDHSRHITKIFEKVVHSLNVEKFEPSFEIERKVLLDNIDSQHIRNLLASNKNLSGCDFFICVNINAGELSFHRRWPKAYFAKVVNELTKKPNVAVLLIGAKSDIKYVEEFRKLLFDSNRVVDISGRTNRIRELIGLFQECDLLITNDSGPLHLAYVLGLDTISFFGPETPYLYGPVGKRHYVFYQDLYCSPCLNIYNSKTSRCKKNLCLLSISPEEVLKLLEDNYLSQKDKVEKSKVRIDKNIKDESCNIQG